MDTKALFNIGYGLYVLTTNYDNIDNGCIINTVIQVTSNPLQVSVTVNKGNYTHDLIKDSCVFNVSMLTTETPMKVFEHFGFQSGRKVNKFAGCESENRAVNHVLSDKPSVTYDYYQKNIKPKPQPQADKPKDGKRRWECKICGYVYEGEFLPDDFVCPLCKHGVEDFEELM